MVLTADFDEIDPAEDQQTMAELSNDTRHLKLELIILARGNIVFLRPHYGVRALEGAAGNEPEAEPSESTGQHNTTFCRLSLLRLIGQHQYANSEQHSIEIGISGVLTVLYCALTVPPLPPLCVQLVSAHCLLPLAPTACCAVAHACS